MCEDEVLIVVKLRVLSGASSRRKSIRFTTRHCFTGNIVNERVECVT